MKTLYLQCEMGASGNMLMGALASLLEEPEAFVREMNALPLPKTEFRMEHASRCGIGGTLVTVLVEGQEEDHTHSHEHHHEHDHGHGHDDHHDHDHHPEHGHHHASLSDITAVIDGLPLSDRVRKDASAVYRNIAEAEAAVHGTTPGEVHFHEVGTLDAVADVVGVCRLMELLAPDRIVCSPVHTGFGSVSCAHGILPVPAPATALLLQGIPTEAGAIEGELCTPTGAALLRYFVTSFQQMPPMTVARIGCGLGTHEFAAANILRAFWGESAPEPAGGEEIAELQCNTDDLTGELAAYAVQVLLRAGALDAFTVPCQMKKGRPGLLFTVLCRPEDEEQMTALLFRYTSTIGVRKSRRARTVLARAEETRTTRSGVPIRCKVSTGCGVTRCKPEFEDVAALADRTGVTPEEILREIAQAEEPGGPEDI